MRIGEARQRSRRPARAKVREQAPWKGSLYIVLPLLDHSNKDVDYMVEGLNLLGAIPLEVYHQDGRDWQPWRLRAHGRSETELRSLLRRIGIKFGIHYGSGSEMRNQAPDLRAVDKRIPKLHPSQRSDVRAAQLYRDNKQQLWREWCAIRIANIDKRIDRVDAYVDAARDNPAVSDDDFESLRLWSMGFRKHYVRQAQLLVKAMTDGREPVLQKRGRVPRWHGSIVGGRQPVNRQYLVEPNAVAYMESIGVKV